MKLAAELAGSAGPSLGGDWMGGGLAHDSEATARDLHLQQRAAQRGDVVKRICPCWGFASKHEARHVRCVEKGRGGPICKKHVLATIWKGSQLCLNPKWHWVKRLIKRVGRPPVLAALPQTFTVRIRRPPWFSIHRETLHDSHDRTQRRSQSACRSELRAPSDQGTDIRQGGRPDTGRGVRSCAMSFDSTGGASWNDGDLAR
ncbi:unnamed protein product [Lampetra fluviatilis]